MGFTNTKEINKEEKDIEYHFKLLFIGDNGVGKSSLILRFSEDTFSEDLIDNFPNNESKIKMVNRTINGSQVKLQIWESPMQQRFNRITSAPYRGVLGIFIVYDMTNPDSFLNIREHDQEIYRFANENAQKFLIGNKCDLVNDRIVSYDDAKELADELGMMFLETSAKDSTNVTFAFEKMIGHDFNSNIYFNYK